MPGVKTSSEFVEANPDAFVSPFGDGATKPAFYSSITVPRTFNKLGCVTCAVQDLPADELQNFIIQLSSTGGDINSPFVPQVPEVSQTIPVLPPDPALQPPPIGYHVYLCGGITLTPGGGPPFFFIISNIPRLVGVVGAPPFCASYAQYVTFAGGSYSSIEILVYDKAINEPGAKKVAYGNSATNGGTDSQSLCLPDVGCFDSGGGPWNYDCSGI